TLQRKFYPTLPRFGTDCVPLNRKSQSLKICTSFALLESQRLDFNLQRRATKSTSIYVACGTLNETAETLRTRRLGSVQGLRFTIHYSRFTIHDLRFTIHYSPKENLKMPTYIGLF